MAQLDDLYTALKNADAAGDTEGATKLAAYIKAMPAAGPTFDQRVAIQQTKDRQTYSPINGTADSLIAGYGSAIPRLVRGIGQRLGEGVDAMTAPVTTLSDLVTGKKGKSVSSGLGLPQQSDVDEANRLDAPLLATKAGAIGNVVGNVAAAIPTVMIPGAASLGGSALIGAGLGAATPTSSGESPIKNALIGGVAGPAGVLAGRVGGAALSAGKALAEPFYEAGRQRIAGRVIQRFADDPASIAGTTNAPTITGALPTLAEQTGDAGLARLQDSLRSVDPQISSRISNRLADNNAARVGALRTLAGDDGARDFAVAERAGTAEKLYGDAFANDAALTPSQIKAQSDLLKSNQIDKLMQSPAIQDAMKAAQTNAANAGRKMDTSGSIEGLHNMKLAIDDMISDPNTAGQAAKMAGLKAARDKLVSVIETLSPDYQAARVNYAQMSKPINSFDIAAQVAKKGLSNGSDLTTGVPTINRNALLGALKDEPSLMKQATGRNVGNALSDVMAPQDEQMLRAIAAESDRAGAVATAGNGPGSATAQRMASQNILRQLVGPTGLPSSWAESALANTVIGKPMNLLYGGIAEPKIQQTLAEAILDPAKAKAMLAAAAPEQRSALMNFFLRSAAARAAPTAVSSPTAQSFANRLQQSVTP